MKQLLFYSFFFIVACGNNNTTTDLQTTDNTATEKKSEPATSSTAQGEDIVGEWELVGFVQDTNDNLLIDEAERNNLKTPSYKDYMKLNSDGSGLFTIAKMEGRYESNESSGKKILTWYDKADGRHRIGTVVSVSNDELQIKEPGGNGLFLWKKL